MSWKGGRFERESQEAEPLSVVPRFVVELEDHGKVGKMGIGQKELKSKGGGLTWMIAGAGMGRNTGE